jgi:antitoxin component of MazEF toxin-antitoxin module
MSHPVKIRKIGNSLGVTISEQVREMGLEEGDPDFEEAMEDAREFMRAYPNAMKALSE